jgi:hypothetical protein
VRSDSEQSFSVWVEPGDWLCLEWPRLCFLAIFVCFFGCNLMNSKSVFCKVDLGGNVEMCDSKQLFGGAGDWLAVHGWACLALAVFQTLLHSQLQASIRIARQL